MKFSRSTAAALLIIVIVAAASVLTYQYYTQSSTQSATLTSIQQLITTTQSLSESSSTLSTTTQGAGGTLVLATTTSTVDSGLLDYLLTVFESQYNVQVDVLSKGTGQALAIAAQGDADVVLVHSRTLELPFVAAGFGVHRVGVMYNDFIIIGPKNDPAGIASIKTATKAFEKIYQVAQQGPGNGVIFISRADKSGTNTKELSIWTKLTVSPGNESDTWYVEAGAGMGTVLRMANDMKAYTLTDRATWLTFQDQLTNLKILVQGDKTLLNPYAVIPVNPAKWPQRNYKLALIFAKFLISPAGQDLIGNYTKGGMATFIPIARNYTAAEALGFPDQPTEVAWYDSTNPQNMNVSPIFIMIGSIEKQSVNIKTFAPDSLALTSQEQTLET
jgi:tungstate transport system substrate-binding protein